MSAHLVHTYRYAAPSSAEDDRLHLITQEPGRDPTPFLRARLRAPSEVAQGMRTVSDVVRSRHHVPAAMLARILREADPVLTWGGDMLRVEGFSGCAGLYARADIPGSALELQEARPGTTNVDFNADMRAALARVRDRDAVQLVIGAPGISLEHAHGEAVERKVPLPVRWLRSFLEVASIQARMAPHHTLGRAAAIRFLRAIPRGGRPSDATWVLPQAGGVRLGSRERPGALRVAGLARLRLFDPVTPRIRALDIHVDPVTGASAWRADLGATSLTLTLSPETWRGFSGEGQALEALARDDAPARARVRAHLAWQSELRPAALAEELALDRAEVDGALAWLATQGLVGYDIGRGAWFHRALPFDRERLDALVQGQHPRLRAARALVAEGTVRITARGDAVEGEVHSGDVVHRVRLADEDRCTCPWFARHQGRRGPCKHVLAVEMQADDALGRHR